MPVPWCLVPRNKRWHGGGADQDSDMPSVGEVHSQTDWDPVWTRPNPAVPVPVWDFPKNPGPLGLQSGHSHIAQDRLRPGLDQDCIIYISNMLILYF